METQILTIKFFVLRGGLNHVGWYSWGIRASISLSEKKSIAAIVRIGADVKLSIIRNHYSYYVLKKSTPQDGMSLIPENIDRYDKISVNMERSVFL